MRSARFVRVYYDFGMFVRRVHWHQTHLLGKDVSCEACPLALDTPVGKDVSVSIRHDSEMCLLATY